MHRMFSYEEIRDAVINALLGRGDYGPYGMPNQWASLTTAVANALVPQQPGPGITITYASRLQDVDAELARDVFWDLFRQGYITLGINDNNPGWPFFRLSHFGRKALIEGVPFRFTDTTSYIAVVKKHVPDLDDLTVLYLEEAVQSFYAGCLLATSVMLGVAAENMFLIFIKNVAAYPTHASRFKPIAEARTILKKISEFQKRLPADVENMPSETREDLDSHLNTIQAVIRASRNETGHPTGVTPTREAAYVHLQLFAPFGRKLWQLKKFYEAQQIRNQ